MAHRAKNKHVYVANASQQNLSFLKTGDMLSCFGFLINLFTELAVVCSLT